MEKTGTDLLKFCNTSNVADEKNFFKHSVSFEQCVVCVSVTIDLFLVQALNLCHDTSLLVVPVYVGG